MTKLPSTEFLDSLHNTKTNTEEIITKEEITDIPTRNIKKDWRTVIQLKNKNYYDKNRESIINKKATILKKNNAMIKPLIQELEMLINNSPEIDLIPGNYNLKVNNGKYKIKLEIIKNNGKK